jgi:hypothetical protein
VEENLTFLAYSFPLNCVAFSLRIMMCCYSVDVFHELSIPVNSVSPVNIFKIRKITFWLILMV